jgi:hypothetical protein
MLGDPERWYSLDGGESWFPASELDDRLVPDEPHWLMMRIHDPGSIQGPYVSSL